jgi:hypothetical protein
VAKKIQTEESTSAPDIKVPPAVPGGSEHTESLGRFIDNLLGAERMHRRAVRQTEASFPDEDQPDDPPPSEPPPAVPGGTEDLTRSAKPAAERR